MCIFFTSNFNSKLSDVNSKRLSTISDTHIYLPSLKRLKMAYFESIFIFVIIVIFPCLC